MLRSRFVLSLLWAIAFCVAALGQDQPSDTQADKEKEKKEMDKRIVRMIETAIGDASSLRLPANRAAVYGIAGDLLWPFDDKRSRELFRGAGAELVQHYQEQDRENRENTEPFAGLYMFGEDPRAQILPLVAKHDAELALDLLIQTRPARLAEAMLRYSRSNAREPGLFSWNPDAERVRQEIALEQQFAVMAADDNPEKAIKLIRDSIVRGISPNVLKFLQRLNRKDEKKAASLAGEVIKKLVDTDISRSEDDMRTVMNFLQFMFKPDPLADPKDRAKPFAFSESQVKELANKVAATLLQPTRSMLMAVTLNQVMPMLEKFVPERVPQLRAKMAEMEGMMPPEFKRMQDQQKVWDKNATPEDILAYIQKAENEYEKANAYYNLNQRIAEIDDEARARKLIDQIPDEKARANALEQFEAARITRAAEAGKLDEARKMIGTLTKKRLQIQRLVTLALEFHKKGGEKNLATAAALMKEARALTSDVPDTNETINDVMEVVRGYATVEPETAFKMFDPIVDQINEYLAASAVLARFNPQSQTFKKGELVIKVKGEQWDIPLFRFIPQMQQLGKADLDRMNAVTDRFHRNDAQTIVRLWTLQGFLEERAKAAAEQPVSK